VPGTSLWPVNGDPGQLEQVLMNLAVNARDAMPAGGTLTIRTENRIVQPQGGRGPAGVPEGDYVVLTVEDTGAGMTPEVKRRVFEPFFTTKEVGKGTGLGLATCYGIIQHANGRILVDSEVGEGAWFLVFLPRAHGVPAPSVWGSVEDSLPPGWETVLVVEDEPQVRELIRRTLSSAGYTVITARNGDEAIAAAATTPGGCLSCSPTWYCRSGAERMWRTPSGSSGPICVCSSPRGMPNSRWRSETISRPIPASSPSRSPVRCWPVGFASCSTGTAGRSPDEQASRTTQAESLRSPARTRFSSGTSPSRARISPARSSSARASSRWPSCSRNIAY
jgi:CheY-like chemotaxis protein